MPEIQGEFEFVSWVNPAGKVGRWRGKFAAAPDADWRALFEREVQEEGASIATFAGIVRRIDGASITFDSPDIAAQAPASAIRRITQRTDNRMAQLLQLRKAADDALQKRDQQLAEELRAAEEKYKKL